MRLRDTLKLHNEEEVIVKRTGEIMRVIDVETVPQGAPAPLIQCVNVLLDDGIWYTHKTIRVSIHAYKGNITK